MPVSLRVLIPAVENSVAGDAFRPLDIYPSRKGLNVEIGNTDAEGRLILADALALADEEAPDLLVDMGTLTGAARVALGPELPPFYTDDDALAAELAHYADAENDPLWRLPLWPRYDSMLDSKIADLNNVATGGMAGSIVCALFLKRFVAAAKRWLHFDIYAWTPSAKPGRPEGGECQAARALYALLRTLRLMAAFDPRLTPARPDLAASHLRGKVEAARFADGTVQEMVIGHAPVRDGPSHGAPLLTEALMGERVTIYETDEEGWAWGQLAGDGYVGWLPAAALLAPGRADPQGCGAAHAGVPRPVDQAATERSAAVRRADRGGARARELRRHRIGWPRTDAASCADCRQRSPISSRSPNVLPACRIYGAARPASASTAPASCRWRSPLAAWLAHATATCRSPRSASP